MRFCAWRLLGRRIVWTWKEGSYLKHRSQILPDGSWASTETIWWESEPVLATSYARLPLKLCRASALRSLAKH